MTASDVRILHALRACEAAYLQALLSGAVQPLVQQCEHLFLDAGQAEAARQLDPTTLARVVSFAARVKAVSAFMVRLDSTIKDVEKENVDQLRQLLAARPSAAPSSCPADVDPPADDQAHCAPYREYFVAHFAYPYPSPADKDHLLALVPRHTKTQLDTWFVNNRRRSGWAALRRAHTNGSAEAMRRLVDDVDAGLAAPQVADKVERCRAFFDEAGRDRVSDEIQAIVRGEVLPPPPPPPLLAPASSAFVAAAPQQQPQPSSSRRRIEQRATRGIGQATPFGGARTYRSVSPPLPVPAALPLPPPHARTVFGTSPTDSSPLEYAAHRPAAPPLALPPPRARPLFAASPPELSPLDGGLAQLDLAGAPRYPSTFGSPSSYTSGGRAVSGSSSASFDSLVSYGEALEAQYHADGVDGGEVEVHLDDAPPAVPGSPPATSSLLAFAAGLGGPASSPARHYPARPAVGVRSDSAAAHPYFCTVDELPTSSSLVGFAGARR